MRILFVGDVVGSPGREALEKFLPKLKEKYRPTITIVNGENAASGKGITEKIYRQFLEMGVQAVTMGNHVWRNKDIFEFIDDAKYLVRPANLPENNPGQGMIFIKVNAYEVAIINLQARTFMDSIDNPFEIADRLIAEARKRTPIIFVDFHGEATSEKMAFAWYLDGRVSAVVGTHTHVQTADNRVLPKGTAYITDVGMTGVYDGIIGVDPAPVIHKFLTNLPARFEVPKSGRTQLNGVIIDVDEKTGLSKNIERIYINSNQSLFN
ncbi:TIGR00282 family metallophosphoesterase [Pallidibacillus pasinlerensis]|uniref:TIGR00282 family metallophosphoesterase n=1 Tax=Pallidibacillus pasinlerensis TaxID=2703818 RepID=A0ABX0A7K5_9BACI|nr:TIGR00282 family metallophosphoesterase [Pallidibacillus pasinlerensis]NCU17122.1 TIGR00282 family metallophosphoesterase [Pallidibacillus pasinlerensis]